MRFICTVVLFFLLPLSVYAQSPAPVETVLPDGVKLICRQESSSNLVAITVFVGAGSLQETADNAGIGSLAADALLTGTTNQDSATIAKSIGAIGGNVKAIWQPDVTQIRALILPDAFSDTAYLIADVLKNADFPSDGVESARQDMLSSIQSRADDVFDSTDDCLRETLYAGTAYALPQFGTPDTIKRITRDDVVNFFYRNYRPDDILISVDGNIDPTTAERTFGGELSDFTRVRTRRVPPLVVPRLTSTTPIVLKNYRSDVTAGLMMAGYLAPGVGESDYPAMVVANALLGGMKTSLMFKNLRTKNQYGYEVASNYTTQIGLSDVTGYILYAPHGPSSGKGSADQTPVVKDALLDQFKIMTTTPPTDPELGRAKKFVIGSYVLAHERIEDRSYYLGYSELGSKQLGGYQIDDNYAALINAVTASDVQNVCKKYFSGAPVLSLLLPGDSNAGVIDN